jgi:hypothetical protein
MIHISFTYLVLRVTNSVRFTTRRESILLQETMAVLERPKPSVLPNKSPAYTSRTEKGHRLKVGQARLKVEPKCGST